MNNNPSRRKAAKRLHRGAYVGSYAIETLLARGSFGSVYRATYGARGQVVALKVLNDELASRPDLVQRFEREVEVIRRVQHPNIVRVLEHGRDERGVPYLALELLTGVTLAEHLADSGRLPPERTLEILEPLVSALDAAHALGIVHRDLKPSNVFLAREQGRERVVLLDFGVAKLLDASEPALTRSHEMIGTLTCMSPEQISNLPVDARTDVYALGVLSFRMLAGELPFHSNLLTLLRELHLHVAPPPLSSRVPLGPAFDEVLLRAMSKSAADRYPDVVAFLQAFRAAMIPEGDRASVPIAPLGPGRCALGVYLEVRCPDADAGDVDTFLDNVRDELADVGLSAAAVTGASVLLVLELPASPADELEARRGAIEAVVAIFQGVHRPAGVELRVSCHLGEILRTPGGEPVGGDLLEIAGWVDDSDEEGVFCSPSALAGTGWAGPRVDSREAAGGRTALLGGLDEVSLRPSPRT